jgi:CHASE2 domain-containing sensor protein
MTNHQISKLPRTTWIDFRGGAGTYPTIPLSAVLAGTPSVLAQLRGAIVLVGITAAIKHDVHDTSAPGRATMAGTELQANAVWTAMHRFPLRSAGTLVDLLIIAVLGLLPLLLGLRLAARRCLAGVGGLALVFIIGAQLAFDAGWVVEVVIPLATLLISGLAVSAALSHFSSRRDETCHAATGPGTAARSGAAEAEPALAGY